MGVKSYSHIEYLKNKGKKIIYYYKIKTTIQCMYSIIGLILRPFCSIHLYHQKKLLHYYEIALTRLTEFTEINNTYGICAR